MTEEEISNFAAEFFDWVDDEENIMEGVVTSDQVLEFAARVAQIVNKQCHKQDVCENRSYF
jgi:hypothetical protein